MRVRGGGVHVGGVFGGAFTVRGGVATEGGRG
ncbi:hypothetical protein GA0115251_103213, partial [Streptomyces sp. TverLS-915]